MRRQEYLNPFTITIVTRCIVVQFIIIKRHPVSVHPNLEMRSFRWKTINQKFVGLVFWLFCKWSPPVVSFM